ncbi:MAG: DUF2835 domain-containing protein [Gammaproteobacteria bacterium]|nr:DUF2835 domain-containing protein [Gammaproteobacteria bacterium]
MPEYRFRLAISAQKYLAYYEGTVHAVVVTLANGQHLQFPAESLRPFVSREGVYGEFMLRVDTNNKLQGIERIAD